MTGGRSLAKDVHSLMKNVASFSNGQATVTPDWEEGIENKIQVTITPNDGYYKDGEFLFEIVPGDMYPDDPPRVYCRTAIYHPNIDTIDDEEGEICLNLLESETWNANLGLEDVVQGILFLLYNPEIGDALCCLFSCDMDMSEYEENVKISLRGGRVENYYFPPNPGYVKLHSCDEESARDAREELENMRNKENTDAGKTKCSESGDVVEEKKEDACEELYFGIRRILTDNDEDDDGEEDEDEEEDECDDYFDDEDDDDLCNIPDPGDEEEDEYDDDMDDACCQSLLSWSKMIYGTVSKEKLKSTTCALTESEVQSAEEKCDVIVPAALQVPFNQTVLPVESKTHQRRPTVMSRFYLALRTRHFRKWLL